MGFNRVIWLPGRGRADVPTPRSSAAIKVRKERERLAREHIAARALEGSLISLAALLGTNIEDADGRKVGRLADVVVHWTKSQSYPSVSSIVIRDGRNDLDVGVRWVTIEPPGSVRLRSPAAHVRAAERHAAEVALAHDVLDRQVVDAQGVQIVRPSDVYLAPAHDGVELIGIEVGSDALLRRLGPRRWRGRPRPQRVIDWATIHGFSPARSDGVKPNGRRSDLAGRAGAGLVLDVSAGEVRRLRASEVQSALQAAQGSDAERAQ